LHETAAEDGPGETAQSEDEGDAASCGGAVVVDVPEKDPEQRRERDNTAAEEGCRVPRPAE
jgi:hypothetical protein